MLFLWIIAAVVGVVVLLLGKVLFRTLRYVLFSRRRNKALRDNGVPFIGHFAVASQFNVGGIDALTNALRASVAPEAFPPLASGGSGKPNAFPPLKPNAFPPLAFGGANSLGEQIVICASADGLRTILSDTDTFVKSPEMYDELNKSFLGTGLVTASGELWHSQRRLLTPMFHLTHLKRYTPLMHDEAELMCNRIVDGELVTNVPSMFGVTALKIISRAVFGDRINPDRIHALWSIVAAQMNDFFLGRFFAPLALARLFHKPTREFLAAVATLKATFVDVVEQCRAEAAATESASFDFVAQMALLKDEAGGWAIPVAQIVSECMTFSFAATDTTSNLLSFTMFFLGQRPDVQEALLAECAEAGGDLEKLKLHRAVLLETLRMRPPVPELDRLVTKDTELCGQPIEAGTVVHAFFLGPQLSAEHFEDPLEWRPARWLDQSAARHPFCFLPFSGAQRNCIGQRLAMDEARVLLSHVVERFRIEVREPETVQIAWLATAEPHGLKVVFKKR